MTVTQINEFHAQEGKGDDLADLIRSFVPTIEASDGCRSCQLLQRQGDPTRVVVITVWDTEDAHKASAKNVPPDALEKAMAMLAGPPKGAYYRS